MLLYNVSLYSSVAFVCLLPLLYVHDVNHNCFYRLRLTDRKIPHLSSLTPLHQFGGGNYKAAKRDYSALQPALLKSF